MSKNQNSKGEKPNSLDTSAPSTSDPVIVGIGASAGGLSALELLFEQLPAKTGAAFVVIQHLSPDYQSHMPELLGRRTNMETVQVSEAVVPKPNTVYMLPPGKHVELVEGVLHLREREGKGELNLPIDKFFRSLSECSAVRCAAVVLSGTGSDGSHGVEFINSAGGLVLCQDESSAQFDGMPHNAIQTEAVHIVGPVPELAESLVLYIGGQSVDDVVANTVPAIQQDELKSVYSRLDAACGVDFSQYKNGTFKRRLSRRMMLSKVTQLDQYLEMLDGDPGELPRLADDLMIGVTRFFRDPDGYQRLQNRCIRKIVQSKRDGDELRVWVCGCATGPEAYSVAMLVHDEIAKGDVKIELKMFATDIHPDAIRFAQRGIFSNESLTEIPKNLREKYVVSHPDGFEIDRAVRSSIVFARHDALQDAPFTNLDLVTCRNMLIYLIEEAQSRVLGAFSHSLRNRGILWLGPSETPGDAMSNFTTLDKHWRLFQKEHESRLPLALKIRKRPPTNADATIRPLSSRGPSAALVNSYDVLLGQYAPAGVLVDESLRTLQIFGDISAYSSPPKGRLSGTIEDLLDVALQLPLSILMQRMKLKRRSVGSTPVPVDGKTVEIRVKAIPHRNLSETHYFISFHHEDSIAQKILSTPLEVGPTKALANGLSAGSEDSSETLSLSAQNVAMMSQRMRMLEMELEFTRENLQATVEEVETTNEELQSSNEELTSSNEELQSTNEELYSVNEELHTTNTESNRRLSLLTDLTTDLENVLRGSEIGIVLVDHQIRIRRITPAASDMLSIRQTNVEGELLSNYSGTLEGIDLPELILQASSDDRTCELETTDRRGDPLLLRVMPYRNGTGTLLTMTSLRVVKDTADKLRKLTSIVEDSTDAIIGVELNGRVTSWNRGASKLFGVDLDSSRNVELSEVVPELVSRQCDTLVDELARKGEVAAKEITLKIGSRNLNLLLRVTPILDNQDRVSAAAITLYDVTAMRTTEEQLNLRTRAIDAASNGFIIVDAQAKDMPIVYANQGFSKLTGFRPEETVGRNCRFLQGPHTEPAALQKIRDAVKNETECRVTLLNYRRDGAPFYNDLIITPVRNSQGTVTHFIGVQSDATDIVEARRKLEASELLYRSTFENAAIGLVHICMEGKWLRINKKFCEIVGYTADDLARMSLQDITHPEDLDNDSTLMARMKRGDIPGYSIEKRYIHRDGHEIRVNLTTSLRCDDQGNPDCCISLIEEISDRVEM